MSLPLDKGRVVCLCGCSGRPAWYLAASAAPVACLLPPGSTVVQRRTNSRRESRTLQFLRISKEMLENLVNIDIKNKSFVFLVNIGV